MNKIDIYSRSSCPNCILAKQLLDKKGVFYKEINLDNNEILALKVMRIFNQRRVPQIVINHKAIGGYDSLARLDRDGLLDNLIENKSLNL